MGLPADILLDESVLSSRFFELSRNFHPDFFGSASPQEQGYSIAHSARLNDAYRQLKTFPGRVEALVRSAGLSLEGANWKPPGGLLMQVLEWNEEMDELSEVEGVRASQAAKLSQVIGAEREGVLGEMKEIGIALRERNETGWSEEKNGLAESLLDSLGRFQYIARLMERVSRL